MRVLNAVQRIIMLLLAIPVVIICLNALLRALGAQQRNEIVAAIRDARNVFVLPMFKTVFAGRNPLQDEIVTLVAIGALALAVIFLFRALRSMVGTKPPKTRPAPAKKPAAEKTTTTEKTTTQSPAAASAPAAAPASSAAPAPATAGPSTHDGEKADASTTKSPEDTQSTSG